MKRSKKVLAVLLAGAMTAGMATTAFAKKVSGTIPTAGTVYRKSSDAKDYTEQGSFVSGYETSGKVRYYIYTDKVSNYTITTTYKWKGNLLSKVQTVFDDKNETRTSLTTYKYSKNRLVSESYKSLATSKKGEPAEIYATNTTYKWNGNEAVVKESDKISGYKTVTGTITAKKNGKKTAVTSSTSGPVNYKYENGLLKQRYVKAVGIQELHVSMTNYNSLGYPVNSMSINRYDAPQRTNSTNSSTTTYAYTLAGKTPVEMVKTYTENYKDDGKDRSYTNYTKVVYTAFKSVKQIRNCDGFGNDVFFATDF